MNSKFKKTLAATAFLAAILTPEAFSQSVKYNGDVEIGVVTPREYASAQLNLATTHGAYFTQPKLFVGAGAAFGWNIDAEYYNTVVPIFGDIRKDFPIDRLFTAFVDAKVGYTINGNSTGMLSDSGLDYGFYCYPSAGVKVSIGEKYGVYLKVGYTYQEATHTYMSILPGYDIRDERAKLNAGGFSASIGFAF